MEKEQEQQAKEEITPEESQESPRQDEVVEVEWESAKEAYELKSSLGETEEYLARFLLQHERSKEKLIKRMKMIEDALYDSARRMRDQTGISQELTYELKLPQAPGEKAYFLRKEM